MRSLHLRVTPPDAGFGTGTRASGVVESVDSRLLLGAFAGATATADKRGFDVEIALADADVTPERVATSATLVAGDGSRSTRRELGAAKDGTSWADFLAPTTVPVADRRITDPIPLDGVPAGADVRLEIYAANQLIWILEGPPGGQREKSVVLPAPLGIEFVASVGLVAVSISALVDRTPVPPHGEVYRRVSVSRDVLLRR